MLCCEVDDCDLALLEEDRHCFSVSCNSVESCELTPHPTSKVLTLKRKDEKDIWTIRKFQNLIINQLYTRLSK